MTKLEHLIQELCPDGVEYKILGEIIVSLNTGLNPRQFFKLNTEDAENYYITIREIRNGKIVPTEKTDRINDNALHLCNNRSNLEVGDVLFSGTGTIGETALIENSPRNWNIKEGVYAIKPITSIIVSKYLLYVLSSNGIREQYMKKAAGGTVKSVPMGDLKKIRIPIPPLEVQTEIVRILDKFTELTTELTTKLATELANRKKQYEYYRNNLLTFNTNVEMKKLKDVSESIASGKNKNRSESGKYPVYGSTGIIAKTNVPVFSKKQILVARVGANAGYVHIADGEYDVSDNTLIIDIKTGYSIKYIYHYLVNKNLNQFAKGGGQPLITAGQLKELQLPVPNIEVQERIVNVLDNFEAICCDLNIGLPAEIEARQKQYEYYRDKLLQFAIRN